MDAASVHGQRKPAHGGAAFERELVSGLIGSLADGVMGVAADGTIDLYNGAALNLLDQNGNLTGKRLSKVMQLYDADGEPVDLMELIGNTRTATATRDYLVHYRDGSKANLYLSIAPVYTGYGAKSERGYALVLRDITREKSLEEERDEFISVVSHELRTPIAITEGAISNAQFVAKRSGDIAEVQKTLDTAYGQVLFLSGLVNDLSTLSRAERGVLQLNAETFNPRQLVEDLAAGYRQQAKTKGLELKTEFDPSLEALRSSQLYIREILHNFITNSIKYTERGSVTVSAQAVPDGVRFSVHDTGIGISHSDQQKIFTKFFRSEDYRTRASTGTGLGLYITQKLAALLHAEITADSKLNHGSTFCLTVPNLPATEHQDQP